MSHIFFMFFFSITYGDLMAIVESLEGLMPIIIPFVIGLVVGLLVKTALKFAVGILALVVLMSFAGYSVPSVRDLIGRAVSRLPALFDKGQGLLNALPFTAPAFIIGLLIGVWWQ